MFTSFELRLIFLCLSNRSMKVNYQISCRCSFVRKCYEWPWQSEHQENCGNLTYWNYIMPVLAKKLLADLIIIIIIIFIAIVIISSSLLLLLSSSLFLLWVFLILLPTFLSREGGNNWYFYPLKKQFLFSISIHRHSFTWLGHTLRKHKKRLSCMNPIHSLNLSVDIKTSVGSIEVRWDRTISSYPYFSCSIHEANNDIENIFSGFWIDIKNGMYIYFFCFKEKPPTQLCVPVRPQIVILIIITNASSFSVPHIQVVKV